MRPSLASQLPQGSMVFTQYVFHLGHCGSWLASDSVRSGADRLCLDDGFSLHRRAIQHPVIRPQANQPTENRRPHVVRKEVRTLHHPADREHRAQGKGKDERLSGQTWTSVTQHKEQRNQGETGRRMTTGPATGEGWGAQRLMACWILSKRKRPGASARGASINVR